MKLLDILKFWETFCKAAQWSTDTLAETWFISIFIYIFLNVFTSFFKLFFSIIDCIIYRQQILFLFLNNLQSFLWIFIFINLALIGNFYILKRLIAILIKFLFAWYFFLSHIIILILGKRASRHNLIDMIWILRLWIPTFRNISIVFYIIIVYRSFDTCFIFNFLGLYFTLCRFVIYLFK